MEEGGGRMQVFVRVRPPSAQEGLEGPQVVEPLQDIQAVRLFGTEEEEREYYFDGVFPMQASQQDVFMETGLPVLHSCLTGINGTILAYGQTGSGKTHSLLCQGDREEDTGLLPRLVFRLFVLIARDTANVYEVEAAALQVYNEEIDDLLDLAHHAGSGQNLNVQNGGNVPGLTWVQCQHPDEMLDVFNRARANIVYSETRMNKASSRSHAVFQLRFTKRARMTAARGDTVTQRMQCRRATLNIVDLAGSERIKKSRVEGVQFKEATNINRSLLALGNVMNALAMKKPHVPYRDSKLTRILDGSIGGNCRTVLLICASPAAEHVQETLNCLEFASRAMRVEVSAQINTEFVEVDAGALLADLHRDPRLEALANQEDERGLLTGTASHWLGGGAAPGGRGRPSRRGGRSYRGVRQQHLKEDSGRIWQEHLQHGRAFAFEEQAAQLRQAAADAEDVAVEYRTAEEIQAAQLREVAEQADESAAACRAAERAQVDARIRAKEATEEMAARMDRIEAMARARTQEAVEEAAARVEGIEASAAKWRIDAAAQATHAQESASEAASWRRDAMAQAKAAADAEESAMLAAARVEELGTKALLVQGVVAEWQERTRNAEAEVQSIRADQAAQRAAADTLLAREREQAAEAAEEAAAETRAFRAEAAAEAKALRAETAVEAQALRLQGEEALRRREASEFKLAQMGEELKQRTTSYMEAEVALKRQRAQAEANDAEFRMELAHMKIRYEAEVREGGLRRELNEALEESRKAQASAVAALQLRVDAERALSAEATRAALAQEESRHAVATASLETKAAQDASLRAEDRARLEAEHAAQAAVRGEASLVASAVSRERSRLESKLQSPSKRTGVGSNVDSPSKGYSANSKLEASSRAPAPGQLSLQSLPASNCPGVDRCLESILFDGDNGLKAAPVLRRSSLDPPRSSLTTAASATDHFRCDMAPISRRDDAPPSAINVGRSPHGFGLDSVVSLARDSSHRASSASTVSHPPKRDWAVAYVRWLQVDPEGERALMDALLAALRMELPEGWSLQADGNSQAFFWSRLTHESVWTHPDHDIYITAIRLYRLSLERAETREFFRQALSRLAAQCQAEQERWTGPFRTVDGRRYWHDPTSALSVWHDPVEGAQRRHNVRSALVQALLVDAEKRSRHAYHEQWGDLLSARSGRPQRLHEATVGKPPLPKGFQDGGTGSTQTNDNDSTPRAVFRGRQFQTSVKKQARRRPPPAQESGMSSSASTWDANSPCPSSGRSRQTIPLGAEDDMLSQQVARRMEHAPQSPGYVGARDPAGYHSLGVLPRQPQMNRGQGRSLSQGRSPLLQAGLELTRSSSQPAMQARQASARSKLSPARTSTTCAQGEYGGKAF